MSVIKLVVEGVEYEIQAVVVGHTVTRRDGQPVTLHPKPESEWPREPGDEDVREPQGQSPQGYGPMCNCVPPKPTVRRSGISKKSGKPYDGWFCPMPFGKECGFKKFL